MALFIHNTLSRQKEEFKPIDAKNVRLYECGPTVYHYAHIGNLRAYLFEDLLRRALVRAGYTGDKLTHVMNITDVGHLQSDADNGEDKMAIAAKRESKSPWDIAKYYEEAFFEDCRRLGILRPHVVCRATDHVAEMIAMVQTLMDKGVAYQAGGNVYFDTAKFPAYADFARLPELQLAQGRVEADGNKRNPTDFVLWFTLAGSKYPNQIMKWDSPWGEGFPGWHIECSAMATKYLGDHFDIHCGGIDHIPVHHTNEIAQSEACHGHTWVNYWMHSEFLIEDSGKMSKSKGDFLTLQRLIDAGYSPLHYRYLCLSAHYRGQLRFSYDSLDAARQAYDTLCHKADEWRGIVDGAPHDAKAAAPYIAKIDAAVMDDLNSPTALAHLWEAMRAENLTATDKLYVLDVADSLLGLGGVTLAPVTLTAEQEKLIALREDMRRNKQWQASDDIRAQLAADGILIKDRPEGSICYRK